MAKRKKLQKTNDGFSFLNIVMRGWILPLYSIVTYAAALKTVDFVVEGIDREKCAMIITEKPDEIGETLTKTFESGMTRLMAQGGYSGAPKTVVYFVLNRFQVVKMKELVHSVDARAYITISEVADVFAANQNE